MGQLLACTLLIFANKRRSTRSLSSQVSVEISTLVSGSVGRDDGGPGSNTEMSLQKRNVAASRRKISANSSIQEQREEQDD